MFGGIQAKIDRLAEAKNSSALILLIGDRRTSVRLAAIRALGCCPDDDAYNALAPLLRASEADVRKSAALALADMDRPSCRTLIKHQMQVERDPQVLSIMITALNRLKKQEHS